MAVSYVSKLSSRYLRHPLLTFSERNFESPGMTGSITEFLPMFIHITKCADGDLVAALARLKKHGFELKIFLSIF